MRTWSDGLYMDLDDSLGFVFFKQHTRPSDYVTTQNEMSTVWKATSGNNKSQMSVSILTMEFLL